MDLTALPTQSLARLDNTDISLEPVYSTIIDSHMQAESMLQQTQTIDPNAIILAHAVTDTAIVWHIHNCKVSKQTVTQDLPLPFLYHYDSLDDTIKQIYPLTPKLLAQFNTPMTACEAAALIGTNKSAIANPWQVKISGSLVVFSEALQLAVRLHWTNTGKETQQIYTQNEADARVAAFKDWQFFGRIDILYKNNKQMLVSIDELSVSDEAMLTIDASTDYQYLPANHAIAVIAKLEAYKDTLPWFEAAILERIG